MSLLLQLRCAWVRCAVDATKGDKAGSIVGRKFAELPVADIMSHPHVEFLGLYSCFSFALMLSLAANSRAGHRS
jgi:hypothetical protein